MRDQFGLKPKQQNLMYRTPYPTDQLPLPHKANKIFDLLLLEGQIKLKPYHKIPTDQELKNIKYCKWHNATSHDTNECKVSRQQIQSAIEQGRLKFETPKKPMKIDGHPFPANMVDV